ncbi:MAG: hypothetical protein SGI88_14610 [Candidatus Hydrogenedentes bacterium]|nr:hypothetical protein [Candidatus Hydrogenedentota bacterium]
MLSLVSRHARIIIPGLPHHITQRDDYRRDVFFVDGDRVAYWICYASNA